MMKLRARNNMITRVVLTAELVNILLIMNRRMVLTDGSVNILLIKQQKKASEISAKQASSDGALFLEGAIKIRSVGTK
jgi:hypothetical protein